MKPKDEVAGCAGAKFVPSVDTLENGDDVLAACTWKSSGDDASGLEKAGSEEGKEEAGGAGKLAGLGG